tara:strand:+ start:903 stop:1583 length:681 start_codon:yes stop_codon:yes gene_type:complete
MQRRSMQELFAERKVRYERQEQVPRIGDIDALPRLFVEVKAESVGLAGVVKGGEEGTDGDDHDKIKHLRKVGHYDRQDVDQIAQQDGSLGVAVGKEGRQAQKDHDDGNDRKRDSKGGRHLCCPFSSSYIQNSVPLQLCSVVGRRTDEALFLIDAGGMNEVAKGAAETAHTKRSLCLQMLLADCAGNFVLLRQKNHSPRVWPTWFLDRSKGLQKHLWHHRQQRRHLF